MTNPFTFVCGCTPPRTHTVVFGAKAICVKCRTVHDPTDAILKDLSMKPDPTPPGVKTDPIVTESVTKADGVTPSVEAIIKDVSRRRRKAMERLARQ